MKKDNNELWFFAKATMFALGISTILYAIKITRLVISAATDSELTIILGVLLPILIFLGIISLPEMLKDVIKEGDKHHKETIKKAVKEALKEKK